MNTETTRELISSITKRLGKSPETVEPLIKKLEDDWFDTVNSLKKLTDKDWDTYPVPQRLLLEIKLILNASITIPVVETKIEKDDITNEKVIEEDKSVVLNSEEMKEDSETWENVIEKITEEIQFVSVIVETANLLYKIVKNIIDVPEDKLKRRLRLSNNVIQQKISRYSGAMNFLSKVYL